MKRLFIVLIKYIPIIQMVGMLFNNILYCFSDIYIISYLLDFIIGNSITTTFLLYVCSYVFGFCKWHRFIITANIINLLIANLDAYYRIPISDIQLLIVYHFVAALFICISTYIHIKNNLAGTALGLGIGGLAVSLLNNGCNPLGIFGRNCGTNAGEVAIVANEQYLERKQCADFVELVNGMWQKAYDAQKARQDDRNILNTELFNIYSAMRNGFDAINAKHNEDAFNLYKYSRDSKDELSSEIGKLRTELAVLKATRPYQDALIQCDIRRVAEHADFNLWRRTCRMISGEVVLPNTSVIEGYASYNPCHMQSTTPTPAA